MRSDALIVCETYTEAAGADLAHELDISRTNGPVGSIGLLDQLRNIDFVLDSVWQQRQQLYDRHANAERERDISEMRSQDSDKCVVLREGVYLLALARMLDRTDGRSR